MKTGRMVGIVVVAGIGIGALLNAVLPDLGWKGFGSGEGDGKAVTQTPSTDQIAGTPPATSTESTPVSETSGGGPAETETPSDVPPDVIYILVDGRSYQLRRGSTEQTYATATLAEIVSAAKQATGDENGIRVRIEQKSSSRELAERALRASLDEAGIPRDAVRWKDEPIDAPTR